jgi:hypothetical protein
VFAWIRRTVALAVILTAVLLGPVPRVLAVAIGTVTVSPSVVPVPLNAAQNTSVLVSATVSGVAPGSG